MDRGISSNGLGTSPLEGVGTGSERLELATASVGSRNFLPLVPGLASAVTAAVQDAVVEAEAVEVEDAEAEIVEAEAIEQKSPKQRSLQ